LFTQNEKTSYFFVYYNDFFIQGFFISILRGIGIKIIKEETVSELFSYLFIDL